MADKLETESRIQQDCIRYFRNMYCLKHHKPQLIMFSVPNEGKDLREQLKKKATGLMKGVSDTVIVFPNKVVFCEFKDLKGKQRPDQKLFQDKIILLGHDYWVVRSIKEFKELIDKEIVSYCEKE